MQDGRVVEVKLLSVYDEAIRGEWLRRMAEL